MNLSQLVTDHPQIVEIDINPLLVDRDGLVALDARIKIQPDAENRLIISPYPRHIERLISSLGRAPFRVRALQPQDASLVAAFVGQLSPEDMKFRFLSTRPDLDRRAAAGLCQLDYDRELALMATPASGEGGILAMARFHADPDNIEAEFAVAVRSDVQSRGIGHGLLTYLIELAAARGIERLWGMVSRDNPKMLALARSLGMNSELADQGGIVRVACDLATRGGSAGPGSFPRSGQ